MEREIQASASKLLTLSSAAVQLRSSVLNNESGLDIGYQRAPNKFKDHATSCNSVQHDVGRRVHGPNPCDYIHLFFQGLSKAFVLKLQITSISAAEGTKHENK